MNLFGEAWDNYEARIAQDWNAKVGANDVGVIAGDISWAMRMADTVKDFEYLGKLNGTKIIIRGNHDYWRQSITKIRGILPPGVVALQNDSIRIGGVVFSGTRGWRVLERHQRPQPEDIKIFDREVARFELSLKDAREKMQDGDKLVAILHYPPFNSTRQDSPFTILCEKYGVDVCVYGHLHGKSGRHEPMHVRNGVRYYLTSCDLLGFSVAEIPMS